MFFFALWAPFRIECYVGISIEPILFLQIFCVIIHTPRSSNDTGD